MMLVVTLASVRCPTQVGAAGASSAGVCVCLCDVSACVGV